MATGTDGCEAQAATFELRAGGASPSRVCAFFCTPIEWETPQETPNRAP